MGNQEKMLDDSSPSLLLLSVRELARVLRARLFLFQYVIYIYV